VPCGAVLRYRLSMPKSECPVCHQATAFAARMLYCPQCGWQRKQAETALRMKLTLAPVAFVVLMAVSGLLFFFPGGRSDESRRAIAVFLSLPAAAFLATYAFTRRSLDKLLAQSPRAPLPFGIAADSRRDEGGPEPSPEYHALMKTSPPREVRMARRGVFNLSVILLVVLLFVTIMMVRLVRAWVVLHSLAKFETREWGMVGFTAFLLLVLLSQWRRMARERDLLESGQIALGRVVQNWPSRNNSTITYEFQDAAGRNHRAADTDYTRRLEQGMTVPVFYDRDRPKRRVAACATFHEVVSKTRV
jgi:hypothetical protein